MAPQPGVTFPERKFIVTQLNEATGVETNVISSTALPNNFATDAPVRRQIYDNAKTYYAANPGVYYVYGPTNGGYWTDADRIWDSRICEFPY